MIGSEAVVRIALLTAFLICCLPMLTACASLSTVASASKNWSEYCYEGMAADVDALAGADATDCGFYRAPERATQRSAQACMREAIAAGRAFKTGYVTSGHDSNYCDIAVRRPDGQLLSLFYDFDTTGQWGAGGGSAALWASRCRLVRYEAGTIGMGSFFDLDECTEAPDIVRSLVDTPALP